MLVLARRLNERLVFPCIQAAIQVVGLQGGIVRLGIEAPPDVKVYREEVLQNARSTAPASNIAPSRKRMHHRLSDTLQELSALRRELRGKLPPSAAATLSRIDRSLVDLARKMESASSEAAAGEPAATVPISVAR
jgi:carbon storage regulator CsrA